jgi:hypothetical protein
MLGMERIGRPLTMGLFVPDVPYVETPISVVHKLSGDKPRPSDRVNLVTTRPADRVVASR